MNTIIFYDGCLRSTEAHQAGNHLLLCLSPHLSTFEKEEHKIQMCMSVCPRRHGRSLRWLHNGYDSVSNHQPRECLLRRLIRRTSKKTSKLRVTGLCAWNSPGTGEFPAQMASYAENVSIWWRHHVYVELLFFAGECNSMTSSVLTALTKQVSFERALMPV